MTTTSSRPRYNLVAIGFWLAVGVAFFATDAEPAELVQVTYAINGTDNLNSPDHGIVLSSMTP